MKRQDIQGLRGLAIFGVVQFHFRPDYFPNGYIGVDVFFVLSGFLMASILAKKPRLTKEALLDFYLRRFKRIVPIYAIFLASLSVVGGIFFLEMDWLDFVSHVKWAALFLTNWRDILFTKGYWDEITNVNLLEHTWSLAVEIQYYVVVPFVVAFHRHLHRSLGIGHCQTLGYLAMCSFIAFFRATEISAFSGLQCRAWQFLAGSIAYHLATDTYAMEHKKTNRDQLSRFLWTVEMLLVLLILYPNEVDRAGLKLAVIGLTALILSSHAEGRKSVLSNSPIVYLGDISYLLYLIHWPVIVLAQYVYDKNVLPVGGTILCLFFIVFFSVAGHHTIETWFIPSSFATAASSVLASYLIVLLMITSPAPDVLRKSFPEPPKAVYDWNLAATDLVFWGTRWQPEGCERDFEAASWTAPYELDISNHCVIRGSNSSGIDVFLIGNSFGRLASRLIETALRGRYRTMRFIAPPNCAIYTSWPDSAACIEQEIVYRIIFEHWRPHLIFVVARPGPPTLVPVDEPFDAVTERMRDVLTFLSSHADRVIVDEPFPGTTARGGASRALLRRLRFGQKIEDLSEIYEEFKSRFASHFKRLDLISIPNIERHVMAPLFRAEDGIIYWYNRSSLHSYFMDEYHLSPEGFNLLRQSYYDVIYRNRKIIAENRKPSGRDV